MGSSTSSCLASMTAVCLLRTCFSTYSLPTNIFWLSLQPHLPSRISVSEGAVIAGIINRLIVLHGQSTCRSLGQCAELLLC